MPQKKQRPGRQAPRRAFENFDFASEQIDPQTSNTPNPNQAPHAELFDGLNPTDECAQDQAALLIPCLANISGNKRAPLNQRRDDLYETPPEAVTALMAVEPLPDCIWDPACGPGAIVRVLRSTGRTVYARDLVDYGCPDSTPRVDFLMEWQVPQGATCVLTNPPFKLAREFAARALWLGVPKVVMLMRLAFLEFEGRRDVIDNAPLARIYVFRKRLPMMHRAGWQGPKASSTMAFAWFVWECGHIGPPTLHRISWEEFADQAVQP